MSNTINARWMEYEKLSYLDGAPESQQMECKKAFFAGFEFGIYELMGSTKKANGPEEIAEFFDASTAELREYYTDLFKPLSIARN